MPMASRASRPSITVSVGEPAVHPSTERLTIWSAPACTPARSSSAFRGTPSQRALPV